MEFAFVWFGFAVVTAIAAQARGHNAALWFIIGVLGGVFALLAVLVMNRAESASPAGAVPVGWSPHANASPSGPAVANRHGVLIHQHHGGFWAMGQAFQTLDQAERHIDANRPL